MSRTINLQTKEHTFSLIFLHGFGGSGKDYKHLKSLQTSFPGLKIVLPSSNILVDWYGEEGKSWYHFKEDDNGDLIDFPEESSLKDSANRISKIVKNEVKKVGAENVFLGGSSMGCGMAFHVFSSSNLPFRGFIGTRGLILDETNLDKFHKDLGHVSFHYGEDDCVILPTQTQESIKRISSLLSTTIQGYPKRNHDTIADIEENIILEFLQFLLSSLEDTIVSGDADMTAVPYRMIQIQT